MTERVVSTRPRRHIHAGAVTPGRVLTLFCHHRARRPRRRTEQPPSHLPRRLSSPLPWPPDHRPAGWSTAAETWDGEKERREGKPVGGGVSGRSPGDWRGGTRTGARFIAGEVGHARRGRPGRLAAGRSSWSRAERLALGFAGGAARRARRLLRADEGARGIGAWAAAIGRPVDLARRWPAS
jgi:hypothetical protein